MIETKWGKCKVHWCLKENPKDHYQLKETHGDCLEEVGVPNKGRMLINRTIKPKVGDLVWCNNYFDTINGYIKQVESFDGDEMIVRTRYIDQSKDFRFYCHEFYGVVEMVFDSMGDLKYKRTECESNAE